MVLLAFTLRTFQKHRCVLLWSSCSMYHRRQGGPLVRKRERPWNIKTWKDVRPSLVGFVLYWNGKNQTYDLSLLFDVTSLEANCIFFRSKFLQMFDGNTFVVLEALHRYTRNNSMVTWNIACLRKQNTLDITSSARLTILTKPKQSPVSMKTCARPIQTNF